MPVPVNLSDLFDILRTSTLEELHTAIPATVQAWDPATQTIDAVPAIKRRSEGDDGEISFEPLPAIPGVPVFFPRGGGFSVVFPMAVGDSVLLVFSEVATGEWRASGDLSEPADARRHGIGSCFAIPGAFPSSKALPSVAAGEASIGSVSGERVHVRAGGIDLGNSPTDFAALASKVDAGIASLVTWLGTHTHTSAAPASPTSPPIVPPPSPATCASTVVKCK